MTLPLPCCSYEVVLTIVFASSCPLKKLLQIQGTPLDYCYHLADLCEHFPAYQAKVRALASIRIFLESQHQKLASRYTVKVISTYEAKNIRSWAKTSILQFGTHRPNWTRYTLNKLQVVSLPMSTWNLKLVNVQRKSREHVWDLNAMLANMTTHPDNPDNMEDLLRLPANSKSRFALEEEHAASTQLSHCNSFLNPIGINRDLVERPSSYCKTCFTDDYVIAYRPGPRGPCRRSLPLHRR